MQQAGKLAGFVAAVMAHEARMMARQSMPLSDAFLREMVPNRPRVQALQAIPAERRQVVKSFGGYYPAGLNGERAVARRARQRARAEQKAAAAAAGLPDGH